MKKSTLMALACAMFMAPAVANAQEVTYVEDPAQGYTFNKFQDNWFIEGLGGAGIMMSRLDSKADFGDRLGWKGNLVVGKWFSPIIGLRIGGEFNQMKGVTDPSDAYGALGTRMDREKVDGKYYEQQFNNIGGFGDAMINVTNWWCGYKPGRFYNAIVYGGIGVHWVWERTNQGKGDWKYAGHARDSKGDLPDGSHSRNFSARAGLLNTFRLSNHVNLLLDLRFEEMQEHVDGWGHRTWTEYPSVLLGLSYKFNKTEWTAPIVPVCPTYKYTDAEGDALVNRLADANRKIADLENQLRNAKKPAAPVQTQTVEKDAPLATIYYPINVSKIVGVQNNVVDAVANVMLDENNNYLLTGWADNYTGNGTINTKLRKDRVAGVQKALIGKGVAADRLETTINDGDLAKSAKTAALGRCVTISRK